MVKLQNYTRDAYFLLVNMSTIHVSDNKLRNMALWWLFLDPCRSQTTMAVILVVKKRKKIEYSLLYKLLRKLDVGRYCFFTSRETDCDWYSFQSSTAGKSTSRESDNSLISVDGSENEEVGLRSSTQDYSHLVSWYYSVVL